MATNKNKGGGRSQPSSGAVENMERRKKTKEPRKNRQQPKERSKQKNWEGRWRI